MQANVETNRNQLRCDVLKLYKRKCFAYGDTHFANARLYMFNLWCFTFRITSNSAVGGYLNQHPMF